MSSPDLEAIRKRAEDAEQIKSGSNSMWANAQSARDVPALLDHITGLTATITALRAGGSIPPNETSTR